MQHISKNKRGMVDMWRITTACTVGRGPLTDGKIIMIGGPPRGSLWLATKLFMYVCAETLEKLPGEGRNLIVPVRCGVNRGWGEGGEINGGNKKKE